jgi:hypothetical protein
MPLPDLIAALPGGTEMEFCGPYDPVHRVNVAGEKAAQRQN